MLFSGRGLVSFGIKARTCRPWEFMFRPCCSHVELVAFTTPRHIDEARNLKKHPLKISDARASAVKRKLGIGDWLLYGSTVMAGNMPCEVLGEPIHGMQCHSPEDRIEGYNGRVYHLQWRDGVNLTHTEKDRLVIHLLAKLGTPYDFAGAARLVTILAKRVWPHTIYDESSLFCSEVSARRLKHATKDRTTKQGRPPIITGDPNRWTPQHFCRLATPVWWFQDPGKLADLYEVEMEN